MALTPLRLEDAIATNDSLVNKGISILGDREYCRSSGIIVIGAARGGTSMVAGSMDKLGIYMGDLAHAPVFEDMKLSNSFEKKDRSQITEIRDEYSEKHRFWGWKRPSSINYLNQVHEALECPRYIFVYRDIMSIAKRNSISMLSDLLPSMKNALESYGKSIEFLNENKAYVMMVSYEKALSNSSYFIDQLVKFCEIKPSPDQLQSALEFIAINPEHYIDSTRITKSRGRLDNLIHKRTINGWATLVHSSKPAVVDIFINDMLIGKAVADQSRDDLLKKFNKDCAFNFTIPEDIHLSDAFSIRARVEFDNEDIDNSPMFFIGS